MPSEFDSDAVTDEVMKVFFKYGVIGVVSFVHVTDVKPDTGDDDKHSYEYEGEATLIASPEHDLVTVAAAMKNLRAHQQAVTQLIEQCERQTKAQAAEICRTASN